MRMSGAIKHAIKLFNYVQEVSQSDSTLYDKSKQYLCEISEICHQIEDTISTILETTPPRGAEVSSIQNKEIAKVWDKVEVLEKSEAVTKIEKIEKAETPDEPEDKHIPPSNNSSTLTRMDRKHIIASYAVVLQKLVKNGTDSSVANRCIELIWKWYQNRILDKKVFCKFNPQKIRNYICSIITIFAYYHEHNDLESFISKFESWLYDSTKSEFYIIPYECNQFLTNKGINYVTSTSAVLWDIIWDSGLSEIMSVKSKKDFINKDIMFSLLVWRDIDDNLATYDSCTDHSELLYSLRLA